MKNGKLFVATTLALTILLGTAGSIARASIAPPSGGWKWLGYAYHGFDSFHGATVYAYEYNSTAVLSVTVHNDYVLDKNLNISALKVWMDWGTNYTSTMTTMSNPYIIPWHESRVIPVEFKVPSVNVVSNKAIYAYTIFLEYVNATTGPKKVIGWQREFAGLDFVVYSNHQVEAQKTMIIVDEMFGATDPNHFNSTKAKIWWIKAENESFVAEMNYNRGDFESAKTHYQTGLSMINQAFTEEVTKGGGFDDAQVDLLKAQAESLRASASYLTGLSSMWVLIGVAAVLFAIGYIIRGLGAFRKTEAPAA